MGGVGYTGRVGSVGVVAGAQGCIHRHDDGTVFLAHGCDRGGVVGVWQVLLCVQVRGQHQRLLVAKAPAVSGPPGELVATPGPFSNVIR